MFNPNFLFLVTLAIYEEAFMVSWEQWDVSEPRRGRSQLCQLEIHFCV